MRRIRALARLCILLAAGPAAAGPILCDVNGDGAIDVGDAVLGARIASGDLTPTALQASRADVAPTSAPGDGIVDAADALLLMRAAAGDSIAPCEDTEEARRIAALADAAALVDPDDQTYTQNLAVNTAISRLVAALKLEELSPNHPYGLLPAEAESRWHNLLAAEYNCRFGAPGAGWLVCTDNTSESIHGPLAAALAYSAWRWGDDWNYEADLIDDFSAHVEVDASTGECPDSGVGTCAVKAPGWLGGPSGPNSAPYSSERSFDLAHLITALDTCHKGMYLAKRQTVGTMAEQVWTEGSFTPVTYPYANHIMAANTYALDAVRTLDEDPNLEAKLDFMLGYMWLMWAHSYVPGGIVAAVRGKDLTGALVDRSKYASYSALWYAAQDPTWRNRSAEDFNHLAAWVAATDVELPDVVRSIFLDKGDGGEWWACQAQPQLPARAPHAYYACEGDEYANLWHGVFFPNTTRSAVTWAYGSSLFQQRQFVSFGIPFPCDACGGNAVYKTSYVPGISGTSKFDDNWSLDGSITLSQLGEGRGELPEYERMLWGDTLLQIFDPRERYDRYPDDQTCDGGSNDGNACPNGDSECPGGTCSNWFWLTRNPLPPNPPAELTYILQPVCDDPEIGGEKLSDQVCKVGGLYLASRRHEEGTATQSVKGPGSINGNPVPVEWLEREVPDRLCEAVQFAKEGDYSSLNAFWSEMSGRDFEVDWTENVCQIEVVKGGQSWVIRLDYGNGFETRYACQGDSTSCPAIDGDWSSYELSDYFPDERLIRSPWVASTASPRTVTVSRTGYTTKVYSDPGDIDDVPDHCANVPTAGFGTSEYGLSATTLQVTIQQGQTPTATSFDVANLGFGGSLGTPSCNVTWVCGADTIATTSDGGANGTGRTIDLVWQDPDACGAGDYLGVATCEFAGAANRARKNLRLSVTAP